MACTQNTFWVHHNTSKQTKSTFIFDLQLIVSRGKVPKGKVIGGKSPIEQVSFTQFYGSEDRYSNDSS